MKELGFNPSINSDVCFGSAWRIERLCISNPINCNLILTKHWSKPSKTLGIVYQPYLNSSTGLSYDPAKQQETKKQWHWLESESAESGKTFFRFSAVYPLDHIKTEQNGRSWTNSKNNKIKIKEWNRRLCGSAQSKAIAQSIKMKFVRPSIFFHWTTLQPSGKEKH